MSDSAWLLVSHTHVNNLRPHSNCAAARLLTSRGLGMVGQRRRPGPRPTGAGARPDYGACPFGVSALFRQPEMRSGCVLTEHAQAG